MKRVLVIDEDTRLLAKIWQALTEAGMRVDIDRLGNDALESVAAVAYDVAVVGMRLPGLDGVSLCREMRRAKIATPVLMLINANGNDPVGVPPEVDDHLEKPVAIDEVVARVQALA
ncbi:MAG: two-component system, OmpR family, response regulator [Solirubrobacteraceae bacterium]|jgi:DNA-binding response OmpR family regulator|nr:two-component system, OmpR family, response regulator [Solirubrobacteraceae bacterium]